MERLVISNDDCVKILKQWTKHSYSQSLSSHSSSQNPHQCEHCRKAIVTFKPVNGKELRSSPLPYEIGTVEFTLLQVVRAALDRCQLHRYLLDLLSEKEDEVKSVEEIGRFEHEVKMTVQLKSYYNSILIPNAYIGQNVREREKWDPRKIITRPREGAYLQHRYQIAKSPYKAVVSVQLRRWSKLFVSNTQELSFSTCPHQSLENPTRGSPCISAPAPIEWYKGSSKSMAFAKERLRSCQESHAVCRPLRHSSESESIVLPSRFLNIRRTLLGGVVRLVESADFMPQPDYAVLSYCWGGPQRVCLTRATKNNLIRGVRVDRLAKSVQDGIKVCAELQIPYLWVDSLCIVQDDPLDQQRELGNMAMYYENSVVTICAASAPSSLTGFLSSNEDAYDVAPFVMQFKELARAAEYKECVNLQQSPWLINSEANEPKFLEGGQSTVQLFRLARTSNQIQPISTRAWTFQEMLMSTRMLIYASDQLYWCCRESYTGCGGSNSSDRIALVRPDCEGQQSKVCICGVSLIREIHDLPLDIFTLGQRSGMTTDAQWDMVVQNFSTRELSVEGDKLRALAAVASYFGTLFGARWPDVRYVAGLWYSQESPRSFCRQLLWKSEDLSRARRPKDLRAPSWSWASIDGPVSVFSRYMENIYYRPPTLQIRSLRVEPVSELAPFAEVSCGVLRVRGKLRTLELPLPKDVSLNLHLSHDTMEDQHFQKSQKQFYLLEITPYISHENSPKGLLLIPYDVHPNEAQIFWRCGIFECLKQSEFARTCFNECTDTNVDIL